MDKLHHITIEYSFIFGYFFIKRVDFENFEQKFCVERKLFAVVICLVFQVSRMLFLVQLLYMIKR